VDDVRATGGTARAAAEIVGQLGAEVAGIGVIIELAFLGGRHKLDGFELFSVLDYTE
jgi:adenine phosphoribosyltransferase